MNIFLSSMTHDFSCYSYRPHRTAYDRLQSDSIPLDSNDSVSGQTSLLFLSAVDGLLVLDFYSQGETKASFFKFSITIYFYNKNIKCRVPHKKIGNRCREIYIIIMKRRDTKFGDSREACHEWNDTGTILLLILRDRNKQTKRNKQNINT